MSENQNTTPALPSPATLPSADVSAEKKPKKNKRRRKINLLFWLTVILPTLSALVYFSVWASDQYVSESSFVVRSSGNQGTTTGLGVLLQSAGFARAQDDTYTVQEYMRSRSALDVLSKQIPVRSYYENKGDIFSRFNPWGFEDSHERFYQYYIEKVGIHFDSMTGISVLQVKSFDASESKEINQLLLRQAEELINQLNNRARKDTVTFAEQNVRTAEERVKEASDNLMIFRTRNGVFDLKEHSTVQLGLISKLQDELIVIRTQLDQVKAITPDNPQIAGLRAREQSLRKEIDQQMRLISGSGEGSIARKAAEYQRLYLENELAEKQLAATMSSLESAKAEADRKQLYLEVISQPSEPDFALYPKRLYNILATFIIGLILYGILKLLVASIREHRN